MPMIAVYFTFPAAGNIHAHTRSKLGTGHDSTSTVTHPSLPSISAGAERETTSGLVPPARGLSLYLHSTEEGLTHQHSSGDLDAGRSTPQTPSSLIHFRTCLQSLHAGRFSTTSPLTQKLSKHLGQLGLELPMKRMSPLSSAS